MKRDVAWIPGPWNHPKSFPAPYQTKIHASAIRRAIRAASLARVAGRVETIIDNNARARRFESRSDTVITECRSRERRREASRWPRTIGEPRGSPRVRRAVERDRGVARPRPRNDGPAERSA